MAPLAFVQCFFLSYVTGEIASISDRWDEISPSAAPHVWSVLLMSGAASFSLNICSLIANKMTSPLTLCIAAIVKQVSVAKLFWTVPEQNPSNPRATPSHKKMRQPESATVSNYQRIKTLSVGVTADSSNSPFFCLFLSSPILA